MVIFRVLWLAWSRQRISPEMGSTAAAGDMVLSLPEGVAFVGIGSPKGSSSHEVPY